ncbi:MAG: lactate racemase domain-containing protein [Oscillospiraceae bacterium]
MENPNHSFEDYSVVEDLLKNTRIPDMFPVRQKFNDTKIEDLPAEIEKQLEAAKASALLKPGMSICITASSRGIDRQNVILREIARYLQKCGCRPFIIPAMGSHGGATAEGQRAILTSYGITEAFCGCPVISSMETVRLGDVEEDGKLLEVRVDRHAFEADGIVVFGRIKPHSAFRGPIESGLTKMMCIGLGKQAGADSLHRDGFGTFKTRIPLFGNYVRTHTKVLFGVATIENAYDKANRIAVLKNEEIPEKEPELLKYAFDLMPRILVDRTDVLVVGELGKNFSGSGMDPNITGTWNTPYGSGGIQKQRTVVLDLTDVSHGNGLGIGQADTTTLRFYNKLNFMETYPNALTSTVFLPIKLPMVLRDDDMAIRGAIKTCNHFDPSNPKVVLIHNSLDIEEIYLSRAFWKEVQDIPGIEIMGDPAPLPFDKAGNLLLWQD